MQQPGLNLNHNSPQNKGRKMPYTFPIGVANSVSSNFGFDPIDTIEYAQNGRFEILQIYLNQQVLDDPAVLDRILKDSHQFSKVYYHGEGYLNDEFPGSDYQKKLYAFLERTEAPSFILHFDEKTNSLLLVEEVGEWSRLIARIYGEQSFKSEQAAQEGQRQLEDEWADILFVLTCLANQTGINIEEAITRNFEKKTARDSDRHLKNDKLKLK